MESTRPSNRPAQLIFYAVSFIAVLALGNLMNFAFYQAGFHADHLLGGRPLPPISGFMISHHCLPAYLMLLPWLALVGTPLLTLARAKDYWDSQRFLFRFLAFLSAELVIALFFLFALAAPFIPIYRVSEVAPG